VYINLVLFVLVWQAPSQVSNPKGLTPYIWQGLELGGNKSSKLMNWPNMLECYIVLHYTRLESLTRDKHPSLLGPFVSCKENEVL
jgi:hypothetical protein